LPAEGDAAGVDDDADVALDDELLLLLLPHAAKATTHESTSAASSGFLHVTIQLLLV
jgi:hypothetical protein